METKQKTKLNRASQYEIHHRWTEKGQQKVDTITRPMSAERLIKSYRSLILGGSNPVGKTKHIYCVDAQRYVTIDEVQAHKNDE